MKLHAPITHSDLEAVNYWSTMLGAGPFFIIPNIRFGVLTHHNVQAVFDHSAALGQWGSIAIELMQIHVKDPAEGDRRSAPRPLTCDQPRRLPELHSPKRRHNSPPPATTSSSTAKLARCNSVGMTAPPSDMQSKFTVNQPPLNNAFVSPMPPTTGTARSRRGPKTGSTEFCAIGANAGVDQCRSSGWPALGPPHQ